jgi:hypothetical protein
MSNLQYKLKITVTTPLGTFTGYGSKGGYSLDNINIGLGSLHSNLNKLTNLVLFSSDNTETLLNENILKQSVIQVRIVSFLVKPEA